jgi:hypothetical protein
VRRGVDLEILHVDVCSRLPLFGDAQTDAPGADRTTQAVQVPVYASLTDEHVMRVARVVQRLARRSGSASAPVATPL